MKKSLFVCLLATLFAVKTPAQTTRYFEFMTTCGHGAWQDTSFIAATSNQVLIDTVLANLARPLNQRKFISGPINYGNGGINKNATHWFLWHFVTNQWNLVEAAIEVCDGCPYTDLDSDTAYWVANIGEFCPWSGRPTREVQSPTGLTEKKQIEEFSFYPNPASNMLQLKTNYYTGTRIEIYNSTGQTILTQQLKQPNSMIGIAHLNNGIYFIRILNGNITGVKKLLVEGK